jgi:hypothetical protein
VKSPSILQEELHCCTRRYEQLREQVLAGDSLIATDGRGLALLIRQGMAAWMRAWHDPFSCGRVVELEAESRPINPPDSWQQEATRLLVNMVLSHLKAIPSNS